MAADRVRLAGRRHGLIAAAFVAAAMVLGGGGSPSAAAEILVQLVFAAAAIGWVWWANAGRPVAAAPPRELWWIAALVLAVPIIQLIPLPPALWQALPGRELAAQSLALAGGEDSWQPISLAPPATLASLLAMIPAVGAMLAVAVLGTNDRRRLIALIAAVALAGAVLGGLQLAGGPEAFRLYEKSHRGWLTAFHANRNAAADALLIGSLALSAWFAQAAGPARGGHSRLGLFLTLQAALLLAVVLTGSRTGIALIFPVLVVELAILRSGGITRAQQWVLGGAVVLSGVLVVSAMAVGDSTRLAGVANRFDASRDFRTELWTDTVIAIERFWPVGSGLGSFGNVFQSFERLEVADSVFPNRAHMDYLELVLETGALGPLVLLVSVVLLIRAARRAWRLLPGERAVQLFAIGTLTVMALHSLVDYPFRNMALACLAGVAAGLLAAPRQTGGHSGVKRRERFRADARVQAAAFAALLVAGCQAPLDPVVPAGEAGYAALTVPEGAGMPARYELAPGDVVSVRVYEEDDLSLEEIALDNAGVVSLPLIGDVRAAGLTATELSRAIEAAYASRYLRDPRVSVAIKEARQQTIAVEGEVEQPGVFPYAQGQTLLTALALARSPTETAELDQVMIFRTVAGEKSAGRFDLQAIRGGRMPDVALLPGDVVVVGYSSLRGAYLDVLRAIPVLGIFRPIQ